VVRHAFTLVEGAEMKPKKNRPPMDAARFVIIAHCLILTVEEVEAKLGEIASCIPSPEAHKWWDQYDVLTDAVPLSIAMGLPSDPNKHQQPHDVARMIRAVLPIHSDQSDDEDEIVVNRGHLHLFTQRAKTLLDTLPCADALEQIKWMATELNHYFGSNDRVTREARLEDALEVLEWFADADGLHDPESGIVDVEAAALRAYRKGTK
jgi:hypothetical protein